MWTKVGAIRNKWCGITLNILKILRSDEIKNPLGSFVLYKIYCKWRKLGVRLRRKAFPY